MAQLVLRKPSATLTPRIIASTKRKVITLDTIPENELLVTINSPKPKRRNRRITGMFNIGTPIDSYIPFKGALPAYYARLNENFLLPPTEDQLINNNLPVLSNHRFKISAVLTNVFWTSIKEEDMIKYNYTKEAIEERSLYLYTNDQADHKKRPRFTYCVKYFTVNEWEPLRNYYGKYQLKILINAISKRSKTFRIVVELNKLVSSNKDLRFPKEERDKEFDYARDARRNVPSAFKGEAYFVTRQRFDLVKCNGGLFEAFHIFNLILGVIWGLLYSLKSDTVEYSNYLMNFKKDQRVLIDCVELYNMLKNAFRSSEANMFNFQKTANQYFKKCSKCQGDSHYETLNTTSRDQLTSMVIKQINECFYMPFRIGREISGFLPKTNTMVDDLLYEITKSENRDLLKENKYELLRLSNFEKMDLIYEQDVNVDDLVRVQITKNIRINLLNQLDHLAELALSKELKKDAVQHIQQTNDSYLSPIAIDLKTDAVTKFNTINDDTFNEWSNIQLFPTDDIPTIADVDFSWIDKYEKELKESQSLI